MRSITLAGLLLVLSVARIPAAQPESWTNAAGHVIRATLADYGGGRVTLRMTNGATLQMPLSALCEADQRRIRTRHNESIAPAFVQTACRDASAVLARYDNLPAEGRADEERERVVQMARAVFDERINGSGATNLDAAVRAEITRLRSLLR